MSNRECDPIAVKLAAGEPLDEAEQRHLAACPQCRALAETARRLSISAPALAELGEPRSDEVAGLLAGFRAARERRYRVPAFAWAAGLLLLAVLAGNLLTLDGSSEQTDQGEALLALMDEVSGYVEPEADASSSSAQPVADPYAQAIGWYDATLLAEPELSLPGAYRLLGELLSQDEEDWI
ncbi:MAG: hypothetical protein JXR96_05465 [Deltaproteobacteria bacterium]|nr:hypothetical protein [Deltaproteobacteria bacterium]